MIRASFLAFLCVALVPAPARGSGADAFENRVRPVSGQLYRKAGRLELSPGVEISVKDAFFQKYLFGGKATFHIFESLSLGVSGAVGPSFVTGSTQVCAPNKPCRTATQAELAAVPGEIKMKAGGEVGFSPVYAKLNFLAEKAVHFDLSLLAGVDWFSYRQVLAPDSTASPGTSSALGGHLGIGTRIFLAEWGALRVEFKDYLYPVDMAGSKRWQQQLFVEAGVSIFLPFRNRGAP